MGRNLTVAVPTAGPRHPEIAGPAARQRWPAIAGASPGSTTVWSARGTADCRVRSAFREYNDPVEWAPGAGQFQAADLTGLWDCFCSKRLEFGVAEG